MTDATPEPSPPESTPKRRKPGPRTGPYGKRQQTIVYLSPPEQAAIALEVYRRRAAGEIKASTSSVIADACKAYLLTLPRPE